MSVMVALGRVKREVVRTEILKVGAGGCNLPSMLESWPMAPHPNDNLS